MSAAKRPGLWTPASRSRSSSAATAAGGAAAALDARPPVVPRFAVVPRRWLVERSFARLGRYRRQSRDYECLTATSEAAIQLAMSQLLLTRLTRS